MSSANSEAEIESTEADAGAAKTGATPRRRASSVDSGVLFVLLLAFYHVNGVFTPANDVTANTALPISILNEGNLTFTPDEFPNMFKWQFEADDVFEPVIVRHWDQDVFGEDAASRLERGQLYYAGHPYYLAESTEPGEFVNDYGIGAGLTALPVFAVLHAVLGDLRIYTPLNYYAGKFVAASCIAGAAVILFVLASRFLPRNSALLVAMTYGLGTSVWSTSSQSLWQHGPAALYLALASYFLFRSGEEARQSPAARGASRFAALAGLAAGVAVLSRPTSATFALAVAGWLALHDRRRLLPFVVAGSCIGLLQALYNHSHLGAFWLFGQTVEMAEIATMKTGSPEVWQFNWLTSAAGMLFAPSRGLFVYSPVLLFSLPGIVLAWRDERFEDFRPLAIALGLTALVQMSWYDWWGGWSYGPRMLVDTMVYFGLFLIPVVPWIWKIKPLALLFFVMLGWSLFVQGLGAFASSGTRWNNGMVYELEIDGMPGVQRMIDFDTAQALLDEGRATVVRQWNCDIDTPECRYRLWSLEDNQIRYYWNNFREERARKQYQTGFNREW